MTDAQQDRFERDPDFWWLQFRYGMRQGRFDDAEAARQRLAELGIEVTMREQREEAPA